MIYLLYIRTFLIVSIVSIVALICPLYGQLVDDFSDGDLTENPAWSGDVASFKVNEEENLQLNTEGSAVANLWTAVNYPDGSIEWMIDLGMDFAPSSNNNVIVYLYLDQENLAMANGYAIRIGENGSDDTVELYALDNGSLDFIGAGPLGLFSTDPVLTGLKVVKDVSGNWSVSTDVGLSGTFFREFTAFDNRHSSVGNGYFGLGCKFTTSNADAFIFDNISIQPARPDMDSPMISQVTIEDNQTLIVQFNEQVTAASTTDPTHYSVSMIGQPISAELIDERNSTFRLGFGQTFQNGSTSELTTNSIEDINGNTGGDVASFEVLIPEIPDVGDIIINELLYDPPTNGVDFVEIKNVSNKLIALNELAIINTTRTSGPRQDITVMRIIKPNEIIAITANEDVLTRDYTLESDQIIVNDLPQFVQDGGNVTVSFIGNGGEDVLDSFNYGESLHNPLLSETKGVSLERVSSDLPSGDAGTWLSAGSNVGFATPGYQNSQDIQIITAGSDILSFENLTFSPDNDGHADFLLIKLQPDVSGTVGRIRIFNAQGRIVNNLAESALLGATNYIQWNGTNNEGTKARVGPYIVRAEYIDDQGKKTVLTKTCVLAARL